MGSGRLRPIEHATLPLSGSPGFARASFVLVVVIGDACHACCTVISSHESMMENLLLRVPFLSLGTRIIHWCLTYFIHPLVRLCHRCYCLFYTFYHVCSTFSCHPSFVRECACVGERSGRYWRCAARDVPARSLEVRSSMVAHMAHGTTHSWSFSSRWWLCVHWCSVLLGVINIRRHRIGYIGNKATDLGASTSCRHWFLSGKVFFALCGIGFAYEIAGGVFSAACTLVLRQEKDN